MFEVPNIAGSDTETELQSSGRNQQIFESDTDSLLGLLAFDAAGELSRLDRHRMHRHVTDEFVDKSLPASSLLLRLGALDAVRHLHDGHYRNIDFDFPVACLELFCRTVWPRRSAAMTTLESRISPTLAGSTVCDCE